MLKTAVIGYGYWGKNIARVISQSDDFDLHTVCDQSRKALDAAAKLYPRTQLLDNIDRISDEVDVVAVITSTASHYDLALRFLKQGKHILVTKPFTRTLAEAQALVAFANDTGKTVFVDHTFVFNPAIRKFKEMLPKVGKPYFISSQRLNLGLYQPDVNVTYDLMPHDMSIISYLFDSGVKSSQNFAVRAAGMPMEDIAHSAFELENGLKGLVTVSWLSPFKVRQFSVVGSEGMLVYDDVEVSEKIKFFERGISIASMSDANSAEMYTSRISYRSGDMYSPAIPNYEALAFEMKEFKRAIDDKAVRAAYDQISLNTMKSLEMVLR